MSHYDWLGTILETNVGTGKGKTVSNILWVDEIILVSSILSTLKMNKVVLSIPGMDEVVLSIPEMDEVILNIVEMTEGILAWTVMSVLVLIIFSTLLNIIPKILDERNVPHVVEHQTLLRTHLLNIFSRRVTVEHLYLAVARERRFQCPACNYKRFLLVEAIGSER